MSHFGLLFALCQLLLQSSPRVHVLVVPSWFPKDERDSAGVFFRDQAEALSCYGHRVGVIAQYPRSLKTLCLRWETLDQEYRDRLVVLRDYFWAALPKVPYGVFLLWRTAACSQFARYCSRFGRPDVLHAHSALYGGAIAVHLGRKFGIPVVVTEHSSAFALGLLSDWELSLARRALGAADACIAVSQSLKAELRLKLGVTLVHVVPNVVASRFMCTQRRTRGSSDSTRRILNIGSLDANKSQADLIRAFSFLVCRHSDLELWLVGDGPQRSALESLAAQFGVREKVVFFGNLPPHRIPDLVSDVDVLAVSSRYETFGLAAAEAMVLGKPVVSTRCGGPEDFVSPLAGVLTPVGSPMDLAIALEHVLESLGQYSASLISTEAILRFGGSSVAKRLTSIYEAVVEAC